jgi:hypothetical protein
MEMEATAMANSIELRDRVRDALIALGGDEALRSATLADLRALPNIGYKSVWELIIYGEEKGLTSRDRFDLKPYQLKRLRMARERLLPDG